MSVEQSNDEEDRKGPRGLHIPIGIPVGPRESDKGTIFLVRCGNEFYDLTLDEYRIWWACFEAPDNEGLAKLTTDVALEDLHRSMVRITKDHLIFRIGDSEEANSQWLRTHKLIGIGFGLGQTSDQALFGIGGRDLAVRVAVDSVLYMIWIGTGGNESMWEACEAGAEAIGESVGFVAEHLLEALPGMIRAGVAMVDEVQEAH